MSNLIPQSVVTEWNKSLQEDFAKRSNLHAQAKALFLLWEDASEGRKSDAMDLENVLKLRFRFEGQLFYIPLENSYEALRFRIQEFVSSFDIMSSLALVYYSGSGRIVHNRPLWQPDSRTQPEVDWFSVQEILEKSPSDIVLLLDCWYGAVSSRNRDGEGNSHSRCVSLAPTGRMEILATPSSMAADDASFRKALCQALTDISGRSIRIDELRRRMHQLLGDASDPYYVNLSRGSHRSSITILPSEQVNLDITINGSLDYGYQNALKTWADKAPVQIKAFKFLNQKELEDPDHVPSQIHVANLQELANENILSWTKLAPPCVHDIKIKDTVLFSRAKTGVERLSETVQRWNQNSRTQKALKARDGYYRKTVVLPMKWERDGFDGECIAEELGHLIDIFSRHFHCEVKEFYEIPARKSQEEVTKMLHDILEELESFDLLIVIYDGHGRDTSREGGQCVLVGQEDEMFIDWSHLQWWLDAAPCDVAQILDCCYAGTAIKRKSLGRNEILAACDRAMTTPVGVDAYIKRVTVALEQLVDKAEPFSLLTLHERIKADTEKLNAIRGGENQDVYRAPQPAYKLMETSTGSITLRPVMHVVADNEHVDEPRGRQVQDGQNFLGWVYARFPVCDGDDQKNWQDSDLVEFFSKEDMLERLQSQP